MSVLSSLKESIWIALAHWGVGVMLRRALETHVDVYIQKFEEHMKAGESDTGNTQYEQGYDDAERRAIEFLKGET